MESKPFKFQLNIHIEKVQINVNFQSKMQVILKRGNQKIETQLADFNKGVAQINETLSIQSNIFLNNGIYQEKKAQLTVVIIAEKGNKVAGQCQLDFSTYLNQKKNDIYEQFHLDKCPDKHAKIFAKIKLIPLGEVDIDSISLISVVTEDQATDKKQQMLTPDKQLSESTAKKVFFEEKITPSYIQNSTQPKTPLVSDIESVILQSNQDSSPQFAIQSQLNFQQEIDELKEQKKQSFEVNCQNAQLMKDIQKEKPNNSQLFQVQELNKQLDQNFNNNQLQQQILQDEKKIIQIQEQLQKSQIDYDNLSKKNQITVQQYNNLQEDYNSLKQQFINEENKSKLLQDKIRELYQKQDNLNQNLNHQKQEAENKIKEQENQIIQLKQQILQLKNTIEENNIQIYQQQDKVVKLEYQVNQYQQQNTTQKDQEKVFDQQIQQYQYC